MNENDPLSVYRLTFEEFSDYLYAFVEGEQDSYEISRAFWQEIADRAAAIGAKRVLIEESIEGQAVTFADVFRLASEIPSMGFGNARIAFVDRFLEHSEVNEFGELVAVNRGLNASVFNDLDAARQWLLSDQ